MRYICIQLHMRHVFGWSYSVIDHRLLFSLLGSRFPASPLIRDELGKFTRDCMHIIRIPETELWDCLLLLGPPFRS